MFGRNGLQTQIGPWKEACGVLYFYFDNSPLRLISASSLDGKHIKGNSSVSMRF